MIVSFFLSEKRNDSKWLGLETEMTLVVNWDQNASLSRGGVF